MSHKRIILEVRPFLEDSIKDAFNSGIPSCVNLADLGCALGPNALSAISEIIPLQEKSLSLTVFHHQGRVYLSRYVIIYICHLCQCQEKFKSTLTFTYVKVVSISTNDGIFVSMTYVNVSFTFVKVGFNICQDFLILCQC